MFSEKAMPLFEVTRRACAWQLALEDRAAAERAEAAGEALQRAGAATVVVAQQSERNIAHSLQLRRWRA